VGVALSSGSTDGIGTNVRLYNPYAVNISPDGTFAVIADSYNHMVRHIVLSTVSVQPIAGNGDAAGSVDSLSTNSKFNFPCGLTISPNSVFALVADSNNNLIRSIVISTVSVSTLAGLALSSGSTNGIGTNAKFNNPFGVIISPDGSAAFVTDTINHLIRRIDIATAAVTTFFGGSGGSANGIGTNGKLNSPRGISLSSDGVFALIADSSNHLIRSLVLSTASMTTLAGVATSSGATNGIGTNAKLYYPTAISISPNGLFALITEPNYSQIRLIVISTASVSVLTGGVSSGTSDGIGTNAQFYLPYGVAISSDGLSALVADTYNQLIRRIIISTASVITMAGTGTAGFSDGFGTNSKFQNPYGVCVFPNNDIALIADSTNSMIRMINGASGYPTTVPTSEPSEAPSLSPSYSPSQVPSDTPSRSPTYRPSVSPSLSPSTSPSCLPSVSPSFSPSTSPSCFPSVSPSFSPSTSPSS
jgi:hypothetical protein